MYKHPEIDYTPQHPMLKSFEPSEASAATIAKCTAKSLFGGGKFCYRDAEWAEIQKKYNELGSQSSIVNVLLNEFADKYYKDKKAGKFSGGGDKYNWDKKLVSKLTWTNDAYGLLRKNKEKGKANPPCCAIKK